MFNVWACLCAHSHVRLFATTWIIALGAPLSMDFSRQEHWDGLLFPLPEDLPDSVIETVSLTSPALAGRFFTNSASWEARTNLAFIF